mmetsp:Transcript_124790/g.334969  ORF Transcript_124790/g.334969 Transcript_124790/m.334969 type:complete len:285 (+) Transcript_124790:385-1239(+)
MRRVAGDVNGHPVQASRVRRSRRVGDDHGGDKRRICLRKLHGTLAALRGATHDDLLRVAVEVLDDVLRDVLGLEETISGPARGRASRPALGHDDHARERVGKSAVGHGAARVRGRTQVVRGRGGLIVRHRVALGAVEAPARAIVERRALVPGQHSGKALRVLQGPLALPVAVQVEVHWVRMQRVVVPLRGKVQLVRHAVHGGHEAAGAETRLQERDGVWLLPLRLSGEVPSDRARIRHGHGRAQPRLAPLRDPGGSRDLVVAHHEGDRSAAQRCRGDRASETHG